MAGPRSDRDGHRPRRDRRSVRWLAMAAAFLVVASMVMRASFSLGADGVDRIPEGDPATGTIALSTMTDTPLFDDVHLAPGESVEGCIRVDARGDVDPDPVALGLDGFSGADLAAHLDVVVERGYGAGPTSDCGTFVSTARIASGSLLDLATDGPDTDDTAWDPPAGSTHTSYRIVVTLAPDVADVLQGTTSQTDFVWATGGTGQGGTASNEVLVRPGEVLRGTFVPLLSLLVACLVALGMVLARARPRDRGPSPTDASSTAYETR